MNVRFDDPFSDTITASNTSCGTITVTEESTGGSGGGVDTGGSGGDTGGSGGDPTSPGMGGIGLPDDPAVLGGVGLLVVIIVALLVI